LVRNLQQDIGVTRFPIEPAPTGEILSLQLPPVILNPTEREELSVNTFLVHSDCDMTGDEKPEQFDTP
jgi:hypothetical protein